MITTKKTIATVTPKKPIKASINKPSLNTNNSEKPSVRSSSVTSKSTEKKSSDIPNTTATPAKKSTEPSIPKPSPVTLKKIPKLNLANKQNLTEKPILSKSSSDPKPDLLSTGGTTLSNNRELNTSEKDLSKRPNRSSPVELDESLNNILAKQSLASNQRYPSLLDSNPRTTSNTARMSSTNPENTQPQSPLSPVKLLLSEK